MRTPLITALAAIAAAALIPTSATAEPQATPIDITGAELAGSSGGVDIDVFGTIRCATAGPVVINVNVEQDPLGTATGTNVGLACGHPGDTIPWVVTANGEFFVPGEKVHITATVTGAANGTDEEDHTLRRGS